MYHMETRFGIVGTGRISDWILKGAVQDPRFRATAVCSRSEEHARDFISRHPEAFGSDAKIFTSVEEMASCPDVDAVYIGTPNKTHHPFTLACLSRGKHVICEKPLACDEKEVQEMIDASRSNGAALMEAMISTLNPNFLAARELMGKIGTVRHYHSGFCQYSSKYEDLKRGIVSNSFNPKMGGGALADIGIYTTYPAIVLFGAPKKVLPAMVNVPSDSGDVNIQGSVTLEYEGMTADLVFSKACDSLVPTEICGEEGNILLDAVHICRELQYAPHAAPTSGRGKGASKQIICSGLEYDEYYYEFKEFIDVVQSGRLESEINSQLNSLENRRLMDAIARA